MYLLSDLSAGVTGEVHHVDCGYHIVGMKNPAAPDIAHCRGLTPMSDLYDEDILLWSEHQAELLRRIAAGEPVNERPDWGNIIEEVESVGREQLHARRVAVVPGAVHMLKAGGLAARLAMSAMACRREGVSRPGAAAIRAFHAAATSTLPASTPTR